MAAERNSKKKKSKKRKAPTWEKLVLAIVMLINGLLSVILAVMRRGEVIHAVEQDDDVKLLLTSKAKTEKG